MKKPLIEIQPGTAIDPDQVSTVLDLTVATSGDPVGPFTRVTMRNGIRYDLDRPYPAVFDEINAAREEPIR